LFETGSVSHPTATIEPRRLSSASRYPTFPSGVSRSARFAAPAIPFSRSRRTAASMSPFVSCSARLQSIIGAPVWSRSSLTRAAEISAIGLDLFGDRLLSRRDLLVVAFRHGLLLFDPGASVRDRRLGEVRRGRLLLARGDAVGDHAHD